MDHIINHFINLVSIAIHGIETITTMAMNVDKPRNYNLSFQINNFIIRYLGFIFRHWSNIDNLFIKS